MIVIWVQAENIIEVCPAKCLDLGEHWMHEICIVPLHDQ